MILNLVSTHHRNGAACLPHLCAIAPGEVLMSLNGWLQIFLFMAVVLLLAKPMGSYLRRVFERRKTFLDPVLAPCERLLYRMTGINPDKKCDGPSMRLPCSSSARRR